MSTQESELEILRKEMRDVKIVLANPTSNTNYVKMTSGKNPLYSMLIPNKLLFLWQKHRILKGSLGQRSDFISLANASLPADAITLKRTPTLEKKLQDEISRFYAKLKKIRGGPQRKRLLLKSVNVMVMQDDALLPSAGELEDSQAPAQGSSDASSNDGSALTSTSVTSDTMTSANTIPSLTSSMIPDASSAPVTSYSTITLASSNPLTSTIPRSIVHSAPVMSTLPFTSSCSDPALTNAILLTSSAPGTNIIPGISSIPVTSTIPFTSVAAPLTNTIPRTSSIPVTRSTLSVPYPVTDTTVATSASEDASVPENRANFSAGQCVPSIIPLHGTYS